MATTTNRTKEVAFIKVMEPLLNNYEELQISKGNSLASYIISLRTNLMVHIKHTQKNKFVPNSYYVAMQITAIPNKPFMEEWLKRSRKATESIIKKGNYKDEKYMSGKWQTWERKFNEWIYHDRKLNILVGKVHKLK